MEFGRIMSLREAGGRSYPSDLDMVLPLLSLCQFLCVSRLYVSGCC